MRHNNIGAHAWVKWIDCILSCFVPMSISISICSFWTVRCSLFRLLIYDTAYTMHAIFCCCCCSFWSFSPSPSVSFSSLVSVNYFSHSRSRLKLLRARESHTHTHTSLMNAAQQSSELLFKCTIIFTDLFIWSEHADTWTQAAPSTFNDLIYFWCFFFKGP